MFKRRINHARARRLRRQADNLERHNERLWDVYVNAEHPDPVRLEIHEATKKCIARARWLADQLERPV